MTRGQMLRGMGADGCQEHGTSACSTSLSDSSNIHAISGSDSAGR